MMMASESHRSIQEPVSQDTLPSSEWRLFLSYRREAAATPIAAWLDTELEGTTIESETGIHTMRIYYDRRTRVASDFQKPLQEHLRHSRALILIVTAGAVKCQRSVNSPDFLYDELEWWHQNKKAPPIILAVDDEAATQLVTQARFRNWLNSTRYECFWSKWSEDETVLLREQQSLLATLRLAVRDYGKIIEIEDAKRLRVLVRRLRLLLAGVVALGLLFLAAAVFSNFERLQAKAQEQSARSRTFAALSTSRPANEYELPVLLGLKALCLDDNVQTRQALLLALRRSPSFVSAWHTNLEWISAAGLRPHHRQILFSGTTNRAVLWDCATGNPIPTIELPSAATYHWSRNGLMLAWTDTDNHLGLYDLTTRQTIWIVRDFESEPYAWFSDVEWSPKGDVIASVEGHDERWVVLRQVETGAEITRHREDSKVGLAWEPSGRLLIASGPDSVEILSPFEEWRRVASLDGTRERPLWSNELGGWVWLALKKNLCYWCPASPDSFVRIAVTDSEQETAELALSPDGMSAACTSYDGNLNVVNLSHQTVSWTLKMTESTETAPDCFNGISWSPDGHWIAGRVSDFTRAFRATNSEAVKIVSVEQRAVTRECLGGTAIPEPFTLWLDDSRHLLSADHNGDVLLWDALGDGLEERIFTGQGVYKVRRDASTERLAWLAGNTGFTWDAHTSETIRRTFDKDGETLAISPDGQRIAVLLEDEKFIRLFDSHFQEAGRVGFPSIDGVIRCLAWHPNGELLAVGAPGRLSLIRVSNGKVEQEIPSETNEEQRSREERGQAAPTYVDLAWSADGKWLATVDGETELVLWEFDGILKRYRAVTAHQRNARTISWSPDGTRVATGGNDQLARIWSVPGLTLLNELRGHDSAVDMVDWSSDGRWLVTSGSDNTIRIWDPLTGRIIFALPTSDDSSVAIWCQGNRFVAIGGRSGVRLSNIDPRNWLARAEKTVLPRLSISGNRFSLESGNRGTVLTMLQKTATAQTQPGSRSAESEGELSTAAEMAESIRQRLRSADAEFSRRLLEPPTTSAEPYDKF
jgi:WD40 repeat protein